MQSLRENMEVRYLAILLEFERLFETVSKPELARNRRIPEKTRLIRLTLGRLAELTNHSKQFYRLENPREPKNT